MVTVYDPTITKRKQHNSLKIFLAGTIDMGNSVDWQSEMINHFKENVKTNVSIFNPRRPAKTGSTTFEFNLEEQIKWELKHLEECDCIIMYLIGTSKSPISLLELGLYARSGKLYVICEPDYYRYTNVKVTCEYYNVPCIQSLEEFYKMIHI